MRFVWAIGLAVVLLAGAWALSQRTQRPADAPTAAHVRLYDWLAPQAPLRWSVPAGPHRLELRWRSGTPQVTAVRLHLPASDSGAARGRGEQVELPLQLVSDTGAAVLEDTGAFASAVAVSFVDLTLAEPGAVVAELLGSEPVLVRARLARRSATHDLGAWKRLSAGRELGEAVARESVLVSAAPPQRQAPRAAPALRQIGRGVRLPSDRAAALIVPVAEAPGVLRLTTRAELVQGSGAAAVALRIEALGGGPSVTLGSIEARLAAAEAWGRNQSELVQLSEPIERVVAYPPGSTALRIESSSTTAVQLQFAGWDGPAAGAGRARPISQIAHGRWRRLRPEGAALAWQVPLVEASAPRSVRRYGPVAAVPLVGESEMLLTRRSASQDRGGVMFGLASRWCAVADAAPALEVRALTAAAVGRRFVVRRDQAVIYDGQLLASSMSIPLGATAAACFSLALDGLSGMALATVRGQGLTGEPGLVERRFWPVSATRSATATWPVAGRQRLRLEVYGQAPLAGRLRWEVDEAAPERRPGVWLEHTAPLGEAWIAGTTGLAAHRVAEGLPPLGRVGAWTVRLGDDLRPGAHQLRVSFTGQGHLWVRLLGADEIALPGEAL